jgi:hypothetical protein
MIVRESLPRWKYAAINDEAAYLTRRAHAVYRAKQCGAAYVYFTMECIDVERVGQRSRTFAPLRARAEKGIENEENVADLMM